jgi:hypothetical protein
MRRVTGVVMLAALIGLAPVPVAAHEERLVVGRVEAIDAARGRLVVVGAEGSERRRLEVTPETETLACRAAAGLATVAAGALVRVKYVEKAGSPSRAESILLLPAARLVPGSGR